MISPPPNAPPGPGPNGPQSPNPGPGPNQPPGPQPPPPNQPPPPPPPNTRAPKRNWLTGMRNPFARKPNVVKDDTRSAIEKMRDKVAEFDEDYKNAGERVLGFFMSLI